MVILSVIPAPAFHTDINLLYLRLLPHGERQPEVRDD